MVVLIVIAVFVFSFAQGYFAIRDAGNRIEDRVPLLQGYFEQYNFAGAHSTVRDIARDCDKMVEASTSWSWQVVAALPLIGTDIKVAQDVVASVDDLVDSVALPATSELDELVNGSVLGGGAALTLDNVLNDANNLGELVDVLQGAKTSVETIDDRLIVLCGQEVHLEGVHDAAASIESGVASLRDTFEELEPALNVSSSVKGIAGLLVDLLAVSLSFGLL